MNELENRRKGALYGQAVGDALGAYYEFTGYLGPNESAQYKDSTIGFVAGEWTDDTEQAIVLALAFSKLGEVLSEAAKLAAKGMQHWMHRDGRGCGNLTAGVLSDLMYEAEPLAVSEAIWEDGGRKSAPNGGVMRAVGTAIIRPWDKEWTLKAAELGCKITHWDPRCVASCVALNAACLNLLVGNGIDKAIKEGVRAGVAIEPGIEEYLTMSLPELELGKGRSIGFTYKCVGAGFWALREFQRCDDEEYDDLWPDRFEGILNDIIREAGDTDTNAAVAGALMGSHIGYDNLPEGLLSGLLNKEKLDAVLAHMPQQNTD